MAFGCCFTGHSSIDIKGAARSRRESFHLCKFHAAVSTFVEAARLSPFRDISSPSLEAYSATFEAAEIIACSNDEALRTVGAANSTALVERRFETAKKPMQDINKELDGSYNKRCDVYAEIQSIHDYES